MNRKEQVKSEEYPFKWDVIVGDQRFTVMLSVAVALCMVLLMGLMVQPVQAQGVTYPRLEEYLQIAIEQNPELRSMRYRVEAGAERVREAGVLPDPEINIAYDFNPMMQESTLGRFSVSAMQMFPWFGTLGLRQNAESSMTDAERARTEARLLQLVRDVKIAWFNIAEIREQIRITKENLELLDKLEKQVEARYETASTGQADILRIQMESHRVKTRIRDLEDRLNPLYADFNLLLNREPDEQVLTEPVVNQKLAASDEELRAQALNRHPIFKELEAMKSSAEEQRQLAKYNGRPEFGLGLEVMGRDFGPMSMNPGSTESFIGMATIRVPLFRSRTQAQKRQADFQIRSIREEQDQAGNSITAQLENSLEQFRKSDRGLVLLNDELIPRAEQALRILTEEYSTGNVRFDELLQIQRELLDLQLEQIETLANQNRALAQVESLIGATADQL